MEETVGAHALRQDLRLHAPVASDSVVLIEDPVRNRFFRLPTHMLDWLTAPETGCADQARQCSLRHDVNAATESEYKELLSFLRDNQLLATGDAEALVDARNRQRRSLFSRLFHAYLFVRIPLIRPQLFLDKAWPYVRFLFSRGFLVLTLIVALFGLWLTGRQWDGFRETFSSLASLEGAALYGISLILLKFLHEGGHAFMAKRYSIPVPRIGVAFMLMMPVLYTDTTGAWRLPRRQRMMIGAGGLIVELFIAAYATLAWALLPDGAARSIAFALATLSWVMSVLVNLNPLMRFDGYYLFSDLIGFENLQHRGSALARWKMRETVFGFGDPPPEKLSGKMSSVVILHAYASWIYRFFLFLGIALVVYHLVAKPLGILLLCAEIRFFIIRPIFSELKSWFEQRGRLRLNRQTAITLVTVTVLALALFAPWQGHIRAPAVMRDRQVTDRHLAAPAVLESIEETVAAGRRRLAIKASDPDLPYLREAATARLRLAEIRLARIAADTQERSERRIFAQQVASAKAELKELEERAAALRIVEPDPSSEEFDLVWVAEALHGGRWIDTSTSLGTIAQRGAPLARAYVNEEQLERIQIGSEAAFVPDDPELSVRKGVIVEIAAAPSPLLDLPLLSGEFGGPIEVEDASGVGQAPTTPHFAITANLEAQSDTPRSELRGSLIISADRRAPASRYIRHAATVLLRELNF
ncbi:hypothetical protein [Notoacmeibacter sp. MSK16QG-6]|uniref:hypothetical protein n=1 Tax=Notoacmeibacter sp. MSK16QG-6 TaxID=2957982 RepID=UPI0020A0534A|nr:hypothetical protein [Notoacmeibacter sp. MSK16QG-6]MCP1199611.1 hypothetical protein [Notoacmeibacter sp. MSK16QG-6]